MVLSSASIDSLLGDGSLEIAYSFLPDGSGARFDYFPNRIPVAINDADSRATRFFRERMSAFRLQLTVGPVVKSHRDLRVPGRPSFKDVDDCTDIRETNNRFVIEPGEVVSVITNEHVRFGERVAAIVTPRVTTTDSGLLLATAYIDPCYEGLLRVTLQNATTFRQELRLLEPVAQCIFFSVDGAVGDKFQQDLAAKSVFFGNTWKKILEEDAEPFPRRKRPVHRRKIREWVQLGLQWTTRNVPRAILSLSLVAALVTSLMVLGKLQGQLDDLASTNNKLDDIGKRVDVVENERTAGAVLSGTYPVRVDQDARSASITIPVPVDHRQIVTVWTDAQLNGEVDVSSQAVPGPDGSSSQILVTVTRRADDQRPLDGQVTWMVTTR